MPKTRFTMNQLSRPEHKEYLNDFQLLHRLVGDRKNDTNGMTPLFDRLHQLQMKLDKAIQNDWKDIPNFKF
jgi:hypothetical protein